MRDSMHRYAQAHRQEALGELEAELRQFSHDGLVELRADLGRGTVVRGSWAGCVISYRRGAAGSARRDRLGRARNAFTVLWDHGWLTDEDVAAFVEGELQRRSRGGQRSIARAPARPPRRLPLSAAGT